jgi:hypothetical protein
MEEDNISSESFELKEEVVETRGSKVPVKEQLERSRTRRFVRELRYFKSPLRFGLFFAENSRSD